MFNRLIAGFMMITVACTSCGGQSQAPVSIPTPPVLFHPDPCFLSGTLDQPKGILVESPKIYDDAVLQQQLETNFARLAALSGFDQGSLTSHLGNVTGVNQTYASGSFNIQGPGTNQTVTTAAIPNVQTIQTNTTSTGSTASNGVAVPVTTNQGVTQTTSNPTTNQTVTTQPSVTAPVSTPQPVTPAVTTGFSVQSPAILSEQLQLASRLSTELLEDEGALSDRTVRILGDTKTKMRTRATVGFDVTVAPAEEERDAAAVVEVIVANCEELGDVPPAVTALMPSETTFNVAAVRNTSVSLGAGIATAFLGASGGFLTGHNQYFLVQDQDTLAQVFQPSSDDQEAYCVPHRCLGIRWVFRPVLGKRFVGPERRKMVAQIAFPTTDSTMQYGELAVRTTWRHFDRKTGLLGEELNEHQAMLYRYPVLAYRLNDIKPVLTAQSVEDLGNGQVLVKLKGSFLGGTYVRIGNAILADAPSGLIREPDSLRFVAAASDLMTKRAFLVSRSGEESELLIDRARHISLANESPVISTLDSTFSHVLVSYCEKPDPNQQAVGMRPDPDPMLLMIAGKVYGLADAPLDREPLFPTADSCPDYQIQGKTVTGQHKTLGLTIPTATLLSYPVVTLKPLFANPSETLQFPLIALARVSSLSQADRLVLLKATKDGAEFLLYGSRFGSVTVDPPVSLDTIADGTAQTDTAQNMRYVSLTKDQLTQYKFLVITRSGEAPEAISIPPVTVPDSGPTPVVTSTVLKLDDTALVTGLGLDALTKVFFKDREIQFTKSQDGKSVTLLHLRKAGVTTSTNLRSLDFYFKPVQVKVDVFSGLVQTSARQ